MSHRLQTTLARGIAAFAVTLALAAPAAAEHCRGYHGMGYGYPAGHPDCQNHPGYHPGYQHGHFPRMDACPYAKGPAAAAPMAGKSLGVFISELPNALLDSSEIGYGVNVESVRPDSAAAAAGIRAGDLITEFAGKPVLSGERLRWLVRKAEADKPLDVKLFREGKPVTLSVVLKAPEPKAKCDSREAPKIGT